MLFYSFILENLFLIAYPIRIGLFKYKLIRVQFDSGLHRVKKSLGQSKLVQFISNYGSNWVNKISGQFGFDSNHIEF